MRSPAPSDWTATPTAKPRVTPGPGGNRLSQIRAVGIPLSITNHAETRDPDSVDNYNASGRVPEESDRAEVDLATDGLEVLDLVLDVVSGGLVDLLGAAGAALVDEDQPVLTTTPHPDGLLSRDRHALQAIFSARIRLPWRDGSNRSMYLEIVDIDSVSMTPRGVCVRHFNEDGCARARPSERIRDATLLLERKVDYGVRYRGI